MRGIYTQPFEVRSRLATLGLNEKLLQQACQRGLAAAHSCTEHHPRQSAGYYQWSEAIAGLREQTALLGWHGEDDQNLPYTVNESRTIRIAVATGDEYTGIKDQTPCTSSKKGPRTVNAVESNKQQYELWPGVELTPETLMNVTGSMGCTTWLLLVHRDVKAQEIRSELSRPVEMNAEGRVSEWAERIILASTPFTGPKSGVVPPDVPKSPEIDMRIKRRA
jgi:hypothetical protein